MSRFTPEDALIFLESDMEEAVIHDFCGGRAAVFSARSPDKATPNEDAAALIPFDSASGVLVVADGAGGLRGGAQASATAVYEMCASLEHASIGGDVLREAVLNGIEAANREISTLAIGAATTLALAEIRGRRLRAYHVGDSEVIVLGQKGKIKLQTLSHSPTSYAVESGFLDEEDALVHEDRHLVSNVIGSTDMRIEMGTEIELSARDTVLVACDGLFDNLAYDEIVEHLRKGTLEEAAAGVVQLCRTRMLSTSGGKPSKPDDLTLVVWRPEEALQEE